MNKSTMDVEFSLHGPSGEHIALGPANWGALGSAHPTAMPPAPRSSSLTILQGRDRLSLRAEVAVSDVVGCSHSQFVRGERVQAVERKK